eukprot:scaffold21595_cov162-Skeletonema_dohrnii-CCMP3373.AAC.1
MPSLIDLDHRVYHVVVYTASAAQKTSIEVQCNGGLDLERISKKRHELVSLLLSINHVPKVGRAINPYFVCQKQISLRKVESDRGYHAALNNAGGRACSPFTLLLNLPQCFNIAITCLGGFLGPKRGLSPAVWHWSEDS